MTDVRRALVVGGGVAGLTCAVGLTRRGIEVVIAEINPGLAVQGIGIALQGPTLRALKTIGLLEECVAEGFGLRDLVIGNADCEVTSVVPMPLLLGDKYPAVLGTMRPAFQKVLAEAARATGAEFRFGRTVESLRQDRTGVDVVFSDGSEGRYDLVIGADGINSLIRGQVFDPALKPVRTGQTVWRAMLDRPKEVDTLMMFYGPRNKAGFNPCSEREMYVFLVQNTSDPIRVPAGQLPGVLREQLADFGGVMGQARERIVDPERIVCRPIEVVFCPAPWYRGRIVLVGDAAHATTPHLASGAGMAIEDSIVIAEELAIKPTIEEAMHGYMARRFERSRMVYENSIQLGEWEKNPTDPKADPAGLTARSLGLLAQPL